MVNDTNTLNGALMELGELMAQNLTTQGLIGVSASDGLTTLANDILLIQGGGGSDVPTILFQDSCSSDNTSDYTDIIRINSSTNTVSLTFDSSTNGYLLNGSGTDAWGGKVIPISFQDKIVISVDVKLLDNNAYNQFLLGLANSLTPSNYDMFRVRGDNKCDYLHNQGNEVWSQSNVSVYNNWVTLELTIDGLTATGKLYDSVGTLIAQTVQTINSYSNPYIFFGLNTTGSHSKNVKNIKVQTIGGSGCDCSQYTQQIEDAISFINGDGS